jgi:CheY-like chemotaxis protein
MRGPAETATILLVDDDEGVRDLAYVVLASQGYSVRPVGSAEDAIEVVRREAAPIHLLLTDVMLEGLDGSQLARRLAELRPGIKGWPRARATAWRSCTSRSRRRGCCKP